MDLATQRISAGYTMGGGAIARARSQVALRQPEPAPALRRADRAATLERNARLSQCFTCEARCRTEWSGLSEPNLHLLNQAKVTNLYQPGQTIFYQGNPCLGVYCVSSGAVAIRKTDVNGNSVIVRIATAGDTLGYRAFFAAEPFRASADALEPSRICFIDKNAVRQLLEHDPAIGLSFLRRMARDLDDAEEAKLHASALSVRARLAHLLLVLKDRCGTVEDDGALVITMPLSRQDTAAMVGTRPETIARAVRSLEDDGVARFDGRRVVVEDLDALMDEIGAQ